MTLTEGLRLRELPLAEVVTLQRGIDLPASQRTKGEVPVLGSNGIAGHHNVAATAGPGVVIGRSGSVGKCQYVDCDYWPLNTTLYVSNFHGNHPKYIYYFLRRFDLSRFASGVSVPTLNRNAFSRESVRIHDLPTQLEIAEALSIVEDAVRFQRQTINIIKELKANTMERLFREGLRGEPSKQVEFGEVPQSWQIIPFSAAATVTEGLVDPKAEPFASMIHVGPDSIESATGSVVRTRRAHELGLISGKYIFSAGQIIYSKIRPYLKKVWKASFDGLCSADMYPLRVKNGMTPDFLAAYLLTDAFTRQVVAQQDRTGIPKVNREQLGRCRVPRPLEDEQVAIAAVCDVIQRNYECGVERLRLLSELFETTLTELMSADVFRARHWN